MKTRAHLPALALAARTLLTCGGSQQLASSRRRGREQQRREGGAGAAVGAAAGASWPRARAPRRRRARAARAGDWRANTAATPDLACSTAYSVCGPEGPRGARLPQRPPRDARRTRPAPRGAPRRTRASPWASPAPKTALECGYPQGRCACTTQQSGPPTVGKPRPRLGVRAAGGRMSQSRDRRSRDRMHHAQRAERLRLRGLHAPRGDDDPECEQRLVGAGADGLRGLNAVGRPSPRRRAESASAEVRAVRAVRLHRTGGSAR